MVKISSAYGSVILGVVSLITTIYLGFVHCNAFGYGYLILTVVLIILCFRGISLGRKAKKNGERKIVAIGGILLNILVLVGIFFVTSLGCLA